jgi:PAS domain S-box-containing protein
VAALVLLCILVAGLLYLHQLRNDFERHAAEDLDAVAGLKVRLIENWREERLADGFGIGAHPLVARIAAQAQGGSAVARADIAEWCRSWLRHKGYRSIAVLDSGGKVLASAGQAPEIPPSRVTPPSVIVLSDVREDAAGVAYVELLVPLILNEPGGSRPVGVAMLRSDPADRLFPLIEPWPTPSHTGQVLLVQRVDDSVHVLFAARNQGSGRFPAKLPLTKVELPAVRAATGEHHLMEAVDPLGRRILATALPIYGTTWSLVAHMDEEEIYGPLRERTWWVLLICAALAAVALSGAHLWWRRQIERFRDRQIAIEQERMAVERHYSYLIRHTNDILLLADGGLRIVDANDRALAAYGYGREELLGKRLEDILAPRARHGLDARLRMIASGHGEVIETVHLRKDGSEFPVEASSRVIEIEGERYTQSVIRDVTERRNGERALRQSEERLHLALEVSGLGIWDWHIRRSELYLSPTLLQLIGYRREELDGGDAIRRLLHPEDHAAALGGWEALLDGKGTQLEARMRIFTKGGHWRWVVNRCTVVERDRTSKPVRVIGTLSVLSQKT